ncbi:MAG: AmmeMemoRadiSam system protein B [Patescibacteria group bacterium]
MSIVFSAITPHPPILIPSIGKENLSKLSKTINAFNELEENIYVSKAETILIISPHGIIQTDSFTMNLNPEFEINFEEFGDFSTKMQIQGDVGSAYKIRESLETKAPLQLISQPILDHGCGVPLYLLSQHLPNIKVIPIYYSGLDLESHFKFGQVLKRELQMNKNRFAIIASGDLSHRLTKDSPGGYSPQASKFDKNLIEYLKSKKNQEILGLKEELISEAGECGLRAIIILLGILDGIDFTPELLSYESPFGIGYLTMQFKL